MQEFRIRFFAGPVCWLQHWPYASSQITATAEASMAEALHQRVPRQRRLDQGASSDSVGPREQKLNRSCRSYSVGRNGVLLRAMCSEQRDPWS